MSCWETQDVHELGSSGPSHVETKHATRKQHCLWLFWELLAGSSAAPAKWWHQRHWPSLGSDTCWEEEGWRGHHKIIVSLNSFTDKINNPFQLVLNYVLKLSMRVSTWLPFLHDRSFSDVNRSSRRKERIRSRPFPSSYGQASRAAEKKALMHTSPVFKSSYFLDSINGDPQQTVPFPIISSEPPQPALNKERFYPILTALSVHPFLTHPLSTNAKFPFINFFLSPFLFSQALFCLFFSPPSFPSFTPTIPPSAHSSSIKKAFTFCLSPASAELDRWMP